MVLNTRHDEKGKRTKLRAEAWLEESRVNAVDERIIEHLEALKPMEVSTGLYTDNEKSPGEFEGKKYNEIARNHRPDHLALLPDKIGACSIADGAGLLQLNEAKGILTPHVRFVEWLREAGVVSNSMSHSQISSALSAALRDKLGNRYEGWIEEVWDDYFIYWNDGKTFYQEYTSNSNEVVLSGQPEEVTRVTRFRRVSDESLVGNVSNSNDKESEMDKKKIVNALIANKDSGWLEGDRTMLEAMSDEHLTTLEKKAEKRSQEIIANQTTTPAPVTTTQPPRANEQDLNTTAAPVLMANLSPEVYLQNHVPPALREIFAEGLAASTAERGRLIQTITANAQNVFPEEMLKGKPLNELRAIAALARRPDQIPEQNGNGVDRLMSYLGQAAPVGNAADDEEEGLSLPSTFTPAAKK